MGTMPRGKISMAGSRVSRVNTRKKPISFEDWIEQVGADWLAKRLGLNPFTVLNWRALRCDPQVIHMRAIKRLSKGLVGYDQMIDRDTPTSRVGRMTRRVGKLTRRGAARSAR